MSSDLRLLNRIASEALRFGTLYQSPLLKKSSFIGSSPRPTVVVHRPSPSNRAIVFSDARPQPSLNQLAHLATRSDFDVYPQLRLPASSFGPRRSNNFLVTRKVHTSEGIDSASLHELNRMARLVELTSDRIPAVPIYFKTPTLSESFASGNRVSHMVAAALLGFTTKSGVVVNDFDAVFPATRRPPVSMFSGQPRVPKETFNELLSSKCSALRSKLGVSSTPKGSLCLIASWINRLLCNKPKTLPKSNKGKTVQKKDKASAAEQTAKDTKAKSIIFVPETETSDLVPPAQPGQTVVTELHAPTNTETPMPKFFDIIDSRLKHPTYAKFFTDLNPSAPTPNSTSLSGLDIRSIQQRIKSLIALAELTQDSQPFCKFIIDYETSTATLTYRSVHHETLTQDIVCALHALGYLKPSLSALADLTGANFVSSTGPVPTLPCTVTLNRISRVLDLAVHLT